MTINASSGLISWTPSEAQGPGEFAVTVRAQDNGTPALGHTTTFSVRVLEVNVAPVLTLPAVGTVEEQTALILTANATDADLPANTLTYELVSGPEGATVTPDGRLDWTPPLASAGSVADFIVRVTDDGVPPRSDDLTFQVTVADPLTILETTRNGDEWTIRWRTVAGTIYRIMRTTSLPATEWSPIPGEVTATGDTATRTITLHPEATASFLRVVLVE